MLIASAVRQRRRAGWAHVLGVRCDVMKILLAQISEEGTDRAVNLPLGAMTRLTEAIGEQRGRLQADLRLKNREGHVEITGQIHVRLAPPCQRCLEPVFLLIDEAVRVVLIPQRNYEETAPDIHLGAGDLEVSIYGGDELDLAQILEDEVLLLIPAVVAGDDEEGRCLVCRKTIDELYSIEAAPAENHPFATLRDWVRED